MLNHPRIQRFLVALAVLWIRSLRVRLKSPINFQSGILALWHQDLIACTAAFKSKQVHAFISQSEDGSIFSQIAQKLGYTVSHGSDRRGSSNVRHLLFALRRGHFAAMALDGPKGPALTLKPGTPWLAKKSKRPVWMLHVRYQKAFRLSTWDRFFIPIPFSKITIECEEVIF